MPASGMVTVAVQVYRPPSDFIREENWYSIELVPATDISVELGNTIFMSGCTTSPATTLVEH